MRMVLLRHGESEGNVKRIYAGHLEVPLTERGRAQAEEAALHLGRFNFEVIYSSPLDRAYETAYIAGRLDELSTEIIRMDGFMEMSFGDCEGLTFSEIDARYPKLVKELANNEIDATYPNGECLRGFYERICENYEAVKANVIHTDGDYLIVAHSGVIRALLAKELSGKGENYWHYKIENCGYAVLEYAGKYPILTELNNSISKML